MTTNAQALGANQSPRKPRKGYWARMGGKFLVLSIFAHLLFLTGAAYYIIQIVTPKKLTFKAGVPSVNPVKQLAEHKMSMAKKRKSMSAPAPAKRVVTNNQLAKIILPPVPDMPTNVVTPTQITGIGGLGVGFGQGMGGNGSGDGGGGDGFMAPFGTANSRPGLLVGTFYDLKFLRGSQPAPDVGKNYIADITKFAQEGHQTVFHKYLKGPHPLYTTQIFFPSIQSVDGPKAFGSPKPDEPGKWVVVYEGTVSPPETGVYHFVGSGDDDMIIRFDNKLVLFNCEHINAPGGTLSNGMGSSTLADSIYHYSKQDAYASFARSLPVSVQAGTNYNIQILIGDDVPQTTHAKILVEKEGVNYDKDGDSPILPIFSVGKTQETTADDWPPHTNNGPFWHGKTGSGSILDMLDSDNPANPPQ